jgi:hypothetical protein
VNYRLEIASCCEDTELTYGDYRLLLGVNAPEVISGQAQTEGRVVARDPIEVGIGLVLEQIIEVDQQSEFFTAVANLQIEWTDPSLAFNPESCNCDFKVYSENKFDDFLSDTNSKWPDFTFRNQQGNRWIQNRNVILFHDGRAVYFERFTTDFQVDFFFASFHLIPSNLSSASNRFSQKNFIGISTWSRSVRSAAILVKMNSSCRICLLTSPLYPPEAISYRAISSVLMRRGT